MTKSLLESVRKRYLVLSYSVGDICEHTWHGRCTIKEVHGHEFSGVARLVVIREDDGEQIHISKDDVQELTKLEEH